MTKCELCYEEEVLATHTILWKYSDAPIDQREVYLCNRHYEAVVEEAKKMGLKVE